VAFGGRENLAKNKPYFFAALFSVAFYYWSVFLLLKIRTFLFSAFLFLVAFPWLPKVSLLFFVARKRHQK
jgi:hypothetical protein